jgi:spore maturation protein CgeB
MPVVPPIKKILYVGDLNTHTRCFQRLRALRDLGCEVETVASLPNGRIAGIRGNDGFLFRLSSKLGVPYDRTSANRSIREKAIVFQPDLLWIEKGLTILPLTLRHVRSHVPEVVIASYSEDDMFARHNQSYFYRLGLPENDIVFTTKSNNASQDELPVLGARRVYFIDKAFDKYVHRPTELNEEDKNTYGAEVGFVGTFEEPRARSLSFLASKGFQVVVWGNGWSKWTSITPNMKIMGRPIYGDDYVKALCGTKINTCFLRKMNRDFQTDRTMEIPACGAFMLAERTQEHVRLFEEGKEAGFFEGDDEMLAKVRYYLEHDGERERIARAGRERCLKSGYSHHERLNEMLNAIAKIQQSFRNP